MPHRKHNLHSILLCLKVFQRRPDGGLVRQKNGVIPE